MYAFAGTTTGVERRPLSEMVKNEAVAQTIGKELDVHVFPNPFSRSTTIAFNSAIGYTTVTIVNVLGEEIARLFAGTLQAGP